MTFVKDLLELLFTTVELLQNLTKGIGYFSKSRN